MRRRLLASYALMTALSLSVRTAAFAGGYSDPASCQTVRFSDVGWTDVTATTALITQLLRSIGYTPTVTVLSVPVTFASL